MSGIDSNHVSPEPHDDLTFGLAVIGFALLAADAARRLRGRSSPCLTRATVVVVTAHVLCVWALRFHWSFADMVSKSLPGFLVFHAAFGLVLLAALVGEPWRSRAVVAAFLIVCVGALPAPFRYDEIAVLRLPMLAITGAVIWFVARGGKRRPAR